MNGDLGFGFGFDSNGGAEPDVPGADPSSDSEISTAVFGVEEGQAEFPAGPSSAVFGVEEGQAELSVSEPSPSLDKSYFDPNVDVTTIIEGYEQAVAGQKGEVIGLVSEVADFLGRVVDVVLSAVFSFVPGAQIPGFAVHGVERVGKTTIGQEFAGLLKGSQPSPASSPALSVSRPSQGYQSKISLTDYTGSYEGGIGAIPVTPQAAMPSSKAYPSLSTSLFGAKEGGGLMIFPTSAKGIEAEGSSLIGTQKKQEPVIDTTSLLFLLGMGAVGMVLRKGASA